MTTNWVTWVFRNIWSITERHGNITPNGNGTKAFNTEEVEKITRLYLF